MISHPALTVAFLVPLDPLHAFFRGHQVGVRTVQLRRDAEVFRVITQHQKVERTI